MEELNLRDILDIIWKRKVEILLILLLFFIVGCIYTLQFVTPKYSSSITMVLVSSKNNEDNNSVITTSDITLNSKLISTYSKLIKSKTVIKEVISNLGLNMTENKLKNSISVNSIDNTEIIQIKVESENNELSARIANEISKVFIDKVKEMYNIDNVEPLGEASIEFEPSNIDHKRDIVIFILIGLVVSLMYAIFTNMLDTTIKSSETIEEEFSLPVLASIPILEEQSKNKNGGKE